MLFSKYANPQFLLDQYISCGRFLDFVTEFIEIENERREYEYWLHRVFDLSFNEFKEKIETAQEKVDEFELETTISKSKGILTSFIPVQKGASDGTI